MTNSDFLNQARKLLNEDYKSRHTAEYNAWLANHKNAWMQPHVIVPFPPFVVSGALTPFKPIASAPTEDEVVAKALELYNLHTPAPVAQQPAAVIQPTVAAKPEPEATLNQPLDIAPAIEVVEPTVEPTVEPVAEEVVVEPTVEPVSEEVVTEPVAEKIPYVDEIYKIYQTAEEPKSEQVEPTVEDDKTFIAVEEALKVVPQPAEELAKVTSTGGILPSVLERIQAMKTKWM